MKFFIKKSLMAVIAIICLFLPVDVFGLSAGQYSQDAKFTFTLSNVSYETVFRTIESQSEFVFMYKTNLLDLSKKISIDAQNKSIEWILNQLLSGTDVIYKINDRQIMLMNKPAHEGNVQQPKPKKKRINGIVIDEAQKPVIGAAVMSRNQPSLGTITDVNGDFSLECYEGDTLSVTCFGYKDNRIIVGDGNIYPVLLSEAKEQLEEVVVTAYGTGQKKASVVGSIQTVRPADLKVPATSLSTSFAGRLAGVIAVQRSGEPGVDGANFWIRGVSTLGSSSSSPLIIIDGIQSTTAELNALDPEVIEGFSILKDATATAMYGMRGANGVMIITTKSGADLNRPIINFRLESSMNTPTKIPKFVDGVTFMELYNEAVFNQPAGRDTYSEEKIEGTRLGLNPYIFPNVDWYNELFNDHSFSETFNLNLRGGGRKLDYFSSVTISHEDGMLKSRSKDFYSFDNNIDRMRYAFQNNINAHLGKTSKLSLHLNVILVDKREPNHSTSDIFNSIMTTNPVDNPILYPSEEGSDELRWAVPIAAQSPTFGNPVAYMVSGYSDIFQTTIAASLNYEQKLDFLLEGLKFSALGSFKTYGTSTVSRYLNWNKWNLENYWKNDDGTYDFEVRRFGSQEDTSLKTYSSNTGNRRIYLQAMLEYNHQFGKHDIGSLLIYNQDEYMNNNPGSNILNALAYRRQGVAFRASYSYDNRYIAEFNLGYNGSENFAKGHRFGFFPSIAIGYNLSEEKFFQPLKSIISRMKIRASYGLVGNGDIGGERFAYLADLNLTGSKSFTTGINMNKILSGPEYSRFSNNDLKWEVGRKYNLGLDLTFLKDFGFTFDVFREDRENIFQQRSTIPTYIGTYGTKVYGNYASVRNQGLDFSADFGHSFGKDFYFTFKATFTYAHNKITKYEEAVGKHGNLSHIGQSTSQMWGYVSDYLFADQKEIDNNPEQLIGGNIGPGDIKYKNIADDDGNYDDVIDQNDRVPIGNPTTPEIVYGFGPSITYRHLDFSFFFQGVGKTSLMMSDLQPFGTNSKNRNVQSFIADDRWSPDNQNIRAKYPRLTIEALANNSAYSTYWLRNGSFLKLKNVEIGYTFKNLRLYLRGANLLTFSSFHHWDPEEGSGNGLKYPTQRVYNIGVQMTIK